MDSHKVLTLGSSTALANGLARPNMRYNVVQHAINSAADGIVNLRNGVYTFYRCIPPTPRKLPEDGRVVWVQIGDGSRRFVLRSAMLAERVWDLGGNGLIAFLAVGPKPAIPYRRCISTMVQPRIDVTFGLTTSDTHCPDNSITFYKRIAA